MSLADISIVSPAGNMLPPAQRFRVEAGSANSISPGEPVKIGGTGNNYVTLLTNGEPEISADVVVGIAASESTDTASADGVVDVLLATPGIVYRCAATTPANIDTDAELLAILNDRVTFDVTTGTFTVDENEGDNSDHGLRIVGGDIVNGTIDFLIRSSGTAFN